MESVARWSRFVGDTFAVWVLLFAFLGYAFPGAFRELSAYIVPLLGVVMFGMGLTLSAADFQAVLRRPREVAIGVVAQYLIMPLVGYALARLLDLPPEIAVGVILVGSCPGGTASNVMTYLARGDVALSVAMTTASTLLAPFLTPLWMLLLASRWIPVNAASLFWSIVNVVILPVVAGLIVKGLFRRPAEAAVKALPLVSVAAIVTIVAAVVAANRDPLATSGLSIILVVILHNLFGLALGYLAARSVGLTLSKRKALAIEVGMQNSGLGAALAAAHFTPLVAVPSAIFSVWHNLSGALLAYVFRRMDEAPADAPAAGPAAARADAPSVPPRG